MSTGLLANFHLEKISYSFSYVPVNEKFKLFYASCWSVNGKIYNVTFLNGRNIQKTDGVSLFEIPKPTNQSALSKSANKIFHATTNSTYYQIDYTIDYKKRTFNIPKGPGYFYSIDQENFKNLGDFIEVSPENKTNLDFWIRGYLKNLYIHEILPSIRTDEHPRRVSISEIFGTLRQKLPIPVVLNDLIHTEKSKQTSNIDTDRLSPQKKEKVKKSKLKKKAKTYNKKALVFLFAILSIILFSLLPFKNIFNIAFLRFKMLSSNFKNFIKIK